MSKTESSQITTAGCLEASTAMAEDPVLLISTGPAAGWIVVTASGDLDYATSPQLAAQLEAIIDVERPPRVAVDLSRLDFCDSAGLRCLLTASRRAQQRDGELALLRPPGTLRMKLTITALDLVLRVVEELPSSKATQLPENSLQNHAALEESERERRT
jgi:anti-sigma B factor antagonist